MFNDLAEKYNYFYIAIAYTKRAWCYIVYKKLKLLKSNNMKNQYAKPLFSFHSILQKLKPIPDT